MSMTAEDRIGPTPRQILDAVLHSQDVIAAAIGRLELEMGTVKADVGTLKGDVAVLKTDVATIKSDIHSLERRVIRIDDRLTVIENLNPASVLGDHERRISRLEGVESA